MPPRPASRTKNVRMTPYSDLYIEKTFLVWYANGRPSARVLLDLMDYDEHGRKPSQNLLDGWPTIHGWHTRADILDLEVERQIAIQAVEEKVDMLNRHADAGKTIVDKAMAYIRTHEITKMNEAIRLLIAGVEIEQASRGIPQALVKIADMDDSNLKNMVNRLLAKMSPDEAIRYLGDNVTVKKNILEGESDDTESDDIVEGEIEDADSRS